LPKKEMSLEQRTLDFIKSQNLITTGENLVVAVSGGADSVCLLHILARFQEKLDIKLHVAHLNHQLRGSESGDDASYASTLASTLGIAATIGQRDVAAYREQQGISLEEAAREVRYDFLAEIATVTGAARVAVGHTRDDHAETILMHLLRGTGLAGLRGLQPRSLLPLSTGKAKLEVVRPLLEVSRQETWDYCARHSLQPRQDSSNNSFEFFRNRVRLELLPLLKNYNPNFDKVLLRLATLANDDISYVEEQASRLWNEVAEEKGDVIYLDINKVADLPHAMQRQISRLAIVHLAGSLKDVEAEHSEAIINFLAKPAGKRLLLPHGLALSVEYGRLALTSPGASSCLFAPLEGSFTINVPGETRLPGWQVKADALKKAPGDEQNSFIAHFDLDKVGKTLTARRRRHGDRFQPLGMSQTKKLQDFMVDAKIAQSWRDRIPLVCSPRQILWVVGWRIDDRVKVTEDTRSVLRLEFREVA